MAGHEAWIAGIIKRYAPNNDDEGAAIANAILGGLAILAEMLDVAIREVGERHTSAIGSLKHTLAEIIKEKSCQ